MSGEYWARIASSSSAWDATTNEIPRPEAKPDGLLGFEVGGVSGGHHQPPIVLSQGQDLVLVGQGLRYELEGLPFHLIQVGPGQMEKESHQVGQLGLLDSRHLGRLLPGFGQSEGAQDGQASLGGFSSLLNTPSSQWDESLIQLTILVRLGSPLPA